MLTELPESSDASTYLTWITSPDETVLMLAPQCCTFSSVNSISYSLVSLTTSESGPSSSIVVEDDVLSLAAILPAVKHVEVVAPSMSITSIVPAALVEPVVNVSPVKSASVTGTGIVTLPSIAKVPLSAPSLSSPLLNGTG